LGDPPASLEEFDDDTRFESFAVAHPDVIAKLRETDTIVVNGEGTLHGASPPAVNLLYVAYVAKRTLGKTVHIVNHSCYPDGTNVAKESPVFALYRKVYQEMDFIAVREPVSAKLVADMGITATESFDCLPLFVREHAAQLQRDPRQTAKTVVIGGSVAWGHTGAALAIGELIVKLHQGGLLPIVLIGADAHMAADDVQFAATLQRVAAGHFVLVNATSELEWLRTIANAELLISGRFHHTIAAACLGTPFIVMESNTPKIAGLLHRLESQSFVSVTRQGFGAELFDRARQLLAQRDAGLISAEVRENLIALAERNFWPEPVAPTP
jgi:polysaccharide pyruvyl transferase WcaK-like protein